VAKAERFEDLFVWQEARQLRKEVSKATKVDAFWHDFEMRNQIRGAALSAMDNIAEGFERGSNKEFAHFLTISKGSAGEIRSALYAALDENYLTAAEFEKLRERSLSVSRRCSKLITYLKKAAPRELTARTTLKPDNLIT
jgi:four helix bundle protein